MESEGELLAGQPHGRWHFYDDQGNLEYITQFKNGLRHGLCSFFNSRGIKTRDAQFVNNMVNGLNRYYHKNGKVSLKVMVTKDVFAGISMSFDQEGNLSRILTWDGRGQGAEHSKVVYDPAENVDLRAEFTSQISEFAKKSK